MTNTVDTSKEAVERFAAPFLFSTQKRAAMEQKSHGAWVRYEDYTTLQERLDQALARESALLDSSQEARTYLVERNSAREEAKRFRVERDQLRREVEEAREHKHRIQDCVVDLSEAGYLCFVKHPDGLIGAYDEGDRVFLDVGTGNIDACGLHILSNSALEKKLSEARAKALDEAKAEILKRSSGNEEGYVEWFDDRPYVCEESAYRRIEALKARP